MVVGIAGLGVMGGSIGLAALSRGIAKEAIGFDSDAAAGREALARGCVSAIVDALEELCSCDVVFVAVPPQAVTAVLDRLEAVRGRRLTVTDCASTKAKIVEWAAKSPGRGKWFVAGHPIAGNEGSGPQCADPGAFSGATWVLTPNVSTDETCLAKVEGIVIALGAKPIRMDPEEHDRHLAVLSHLPHVLSSALVYCASDLERPEIGGGSWRDMTRVAGSNPALWQHILLQNRRHILTALSEFHSNLGELKHALEGNDGEALRSFFEAARQAKRNQGGGR